MHTHAHAHTCVRAHTLLESFTRIPSLAPLVALSMTAVSPSSEEDTEAQGGGIAAPAQAA